MEEKDEDNEDNSNNNSNSPSVEEVDYGALLERDIPNNCTSLLLRYNTGLHISTNGIQLNEMLQSLLETLKADDLDNNVEFNLICHSMGGLVARSATQYALRMMSTTRTTTTTTSHQQQEDSVPVPTTNASTFSDASNSSWIYHTNRIIFLGTPHQGSYWECAGNILTCALDSIYYTKAVARLAKLRSPGIQDLRYGYTLEEDWKIPLPNLRASDTSSSSTSSSEDDEKEEQEEEVDQQDLWLTNTRKPGQEQLLGWVQYHTVTGTVMSDPKHPLSMLLGDGLVSKDSAQGRSSNPDHALSFPSTQEFPGIHHNALQCSLPVYKQLLQWMKQPMDEKVAPPEWIRRRRRRRNSSVNCSSRVDDDNGNTGEDGGFVLVQRESNSNNNDNHLDDEEKAEKEDDEDNNCPPKDLRRRSLSMTMVLGSLRLSISSSAADDDEDDDDEEEQELEQEGRFAPYRGATTLVQNVVHNGVTTIEQIQIDWTKDLYRILKTYLIPSIVLPLVTWLYVYHIGFITLYYCYLRTMNHGTAKTIKYVLHTMDSMESILSWKNNNKKNHKRETP